MDFSVDFFDEDQYVIMKNMLFNDSDLFTLPSLEKGGQGWNREILVSKTLGSFILPILP